MKARGLDRRPTKPGGEQPCNSITVTPFKKRSFLFHQRGVSKRRKATGVSHDLRPTSRQTAVGAGAQLAQMDRLLGRHQAHVVLLALKGAVGRSAGSGCQARALHAEGQGSTSGTGARFSPKIKQLQR